MKPIKKPDINQGIFLFSIMVYFFMRDIFVFMTCIGFLYLIKQIYADGYSIFSVNKWLTHYISNFKKVLENNNN